MKKEGKDPMIRFLKVVNYQKLANETGASKQSMWNYVNGRSQDMRAENYNAIRSWLLWIAEDLR